MFQERDNIELKFLNYILYENGKSNREISDRNIQLVRTLSTNGLIGDFIRINLGKFHTWISKKGMIRTNQSDLTNINNTFDSIYSKEKMQQSLSQNHSPIRMLLNRNIKNRL
ncbi:hypothetical protein Lal_00033642 [Lupinus albus]|nr:hypothetical protein Lal_00033642 [Lupinus albus]